MCFYEEKKNRKHNFREIVKKNQRYKLLSTEKNEKKNEIVHELELALWRKKTK